jgi:heparan-alpha-glucosaminide N-acetyltransferase
VLRAGDGSRSEPATIFLAEGRVPQILVVMAPNTASAPALAPAQAGPSAIVAASRRLVSLDAYRGFVMLLMASDGFNFSRIAAKMPDSSLWNFLSYQTEHTAWRGCSLWDLIQPSFTFLVGVALPFSLAKRRAAGQGFGEMLGHAVWRALALTFLGVFLRSMHHQQTYFTFEDTLSQIGMGYVFLFLLAWTPPKVQFAGLLAILVGYWLAFACYPLPPAGFDYQAVGVPANWPHLSGFSAHWDKNTNLAAAFDHWFLNLFPREEPFRFNDGGYLTLSFVPTLGTMILGLLTGQFLRQPKPPFEKIKVMVVLGIGCLALGILLDAAGICPSVKRIWTPAWVIFSGGWCFLLLASFYAVLDWKGYVRWAFPLVVVGLNSIAMYVMDHLWDDSIKSTLPIFLGRDIYNLLGGTYAPATEMLFLLAVLWLICYWMYRRKLFLKI